MGIDRARYLARHRRYSAERRSRWRTIGCCQQCGLPTERFVYCFEHRKQRAAIAKAWWRRRAMTLEMYTHQTREVFNALQESR